MEMLMWMMTEQLMVILVRLSMYLEGVMRHG